jgi:hypothetical protein
MHVDRGVIKGNLIFSGYGQKQSSISAQYGRHLSSHDDPTDTGRGERKMRNEIIAAHISQRTHISFHLLISHCRVLLNEAILRYLYRSPPGVALGLKR